jgi:hypothetical protein
MASRGFGQAGNQFGGKRAGATLCMASILTALLGARISRLSTYCLCHAKLNAAAESSDELSRREDGIGWLKTTKVKSG